MQNTEMVWPSWQVMGSQQQMEDIKAIKENLYYFGLGATPDLGSGVSGAYFVPNDDGTIDLTFADNSLDTYSYSPLLKARADQQAMRDHVIWLYAHVLDIYGYDYDTVEVQADRDRLGHYTVLRVK